MWFYPRQQIALHLVMQTERVSCTGNTSGRTDPYRRIPLNPPLCKGRLGGPYRLAWRFAGATGFLGSEAQGEW